MIWRDGNENNIAGRNLLKPSWLNRKTFYPDKIFYFFFKCWNTFALLKEVTVTVDDPFENIGGDSLRGSALN